MRPGAASRRTSLGNYTHKKNSLLPPQKERKKKNILNVFQSDQIGRFQNKNAQFLRALRTFSSCFLPNKTDVGTAALRKTQGMHPFIRS